MHSHAVAPPGPRLPLLGTLLNPGRDPLELFLRFGRDYGDVTFFRLGGERCFFIQHPRDIKDVLVTHQRNFTKSRGLERARRLLGSGLLTGEGAEHLRHRRLLQPAFHRERLDAYARAMVEHSARMRNRWENGATFDVAQEMMRLTLAIVGQTLFDTDVESEVDEVGRAVTDMLDTFWWNLLPGASVLERLPIRGFQRARAARVRLDALIFRMIEDRATSGRDRADLLSMMIAARDEGVGFSPEEVRDEAMTLLLAGHETTAVNLMWTWYLLSQSPEAETELHRELDAVVGGRLPQAADLPRLRFTRQVVAESTRLYPPAWVIGRRAIEEYRLGPYRVPPRSIIFMSPFATHRDQRWFADPEQFQPARWTAEFEAGLPPFAYFPFGGGTRRCIGEQFAWTEAVLAIATIAQRWRLALAPDQRIATKPLLTLRARYGIRMTAHERDPVHTTDTNGGQDV